MGDWLREEIERECVVEREGWAAERVARVSQRLQRDVPTDERLETLVIWIDLYNAFTGPGRTIYMSRRLLERFADDDAAAFVVAHELAHHRLGHVTRPLPAGLLLLPLRVVLALIRLRVATPARERDADLMAIEMCMEAGYDPARCIAAFEFLDQVVLDYRDIDGSLGIEGEDGASQWVPGRSHPPTRARIEALWAHVAAWRSGHRLAAELAARDQERRARRRRAMAATAGGAALTIGLILLRRRLPGA